MNNLVPTKIREILQSVLPKSDFAPLHIPDFGGKEKDYLGQCIDSNFVSYLGEFVCRFEQMVAEYTTVKRAVATVNGTTALHAALKVVGVNPGDEVLIPALTFVATANAVSSCGAIPHFIDVDEKTLGIDSSRLSEYLANVTEVDDDSCFNKKNGAHIRAIIPMHTFGHPVDMNPLIDVCRYYHIEIIEDAAESLGSIYKNRHTGNFGKAAIMSFNGNKIITTGGGGAILTNDDSFADRIKHITTTGKVPHRWEFNHDCIAFNYRMPAINAALGCAQMEKLPDFLYRKRQLAERYKTAFKMIDGVRFFAEPEYARSNYWLNALMLEKPDMDLRNEILYITNNAGIMTRPVWTLLHKLPMYSTCPKMDLSVSEGLEARIINIPSSAYLVDN